jgi:hypothetical protein
VKKYGKARQATDGNIIRRMRTARWTTTATYTHSEYLILFAFPLNNGCTNTLHVQCTLPALLTPVLSAPHPLRLVSRKKPRLLGDQETKWGPPPIGTFYGRGEPLVRIEKITAIRKDIFQHKISNNSIYFQSKTFIFRGHVGGCGMGRWGGGGVEPWAASACHCGKSMTY